ncbi:hypothetical protein KVR01_006800 [Diaporthe batatas]|uniref:uncharacterized protein n=1 Tax=Diaporthe batatas TaxID=748121 RepID=UPI001D048413|nr:uncharacterized protein KVR01_006800 [Diaporthe batatas]KAG8163503.1 hypothetical protein KVR01_006800 [Diaporthe batatas]
MALTRLATTTLNLPDGPVEVAVGEATPEQQLECCRLAGTAFAAPLSQDQYVELERHLGSLPLAVPRARRYWCLYPINNPNCILATCKTLHRFILVKEGAKVTENDGYCIASVITNPDYRKAGLASMLMGHVAEWMDGPGAATASMLYTSIGDFYAKRGWGPLPAFESTLTCATNATFDRPPSLPGTRVLTPTDVDTLCARDVESVKVVMRQMQTSTGQRLAAVSPTADLINLLQERANFMALKQFGKPTEHRGAISESGDSWLYWYHDFRKGQLAVLRIHLSHGFAGRQPEQLVSLFLDALEEAAAWALPKVTVWDANPVVLEALDLLEDRHAVKVTNGQRQQRSIPSLRWRGDDGSKTACLHCNEFYAWS